MERRFQVSRECGELIRSVRERDGLSQQELASRLGMTAAQVSRLERGQRELSVGLLARIADILGVSPMQLMPSALPLAQSIEDARTPQQLCGTFAMLLVHLDRLYQQLCVRFPMGQ